MQMLFETTIPSPLGNLRAIASGAGLVAILWPDDAPNRVRIGPATINPGHDVLGETRRQIDAYFAGELMRFDLPLDVRGTDFQKQVWNALLEIPYGETRSYNDIALLLGKPNAARAVGAANGRNPISIVTPCHRLVGRNGALTGFAGGLDAKRFLLGLENRRVSDAAA